MSIIPPEIDILPATDINHVGKSAVFNGIVLNAGNPKYIEKGFVFGETTNPAMCNEKIIVDGTGTGEFNVLAENLSSDINYNIWTYATTIENTYYSNNFASLFLYEGTPIIPQVSTQSPTNIDFETGTATFVGTVTDEGYPPYTERGFVYSLSNSEPTIYDNKVISSGRGITGTYNTSVSNLRKGDVYIRAYAMNDAGVAYGNTVMITSKYKELPTLGLMVQSEDVDAAQWNSVNTVCEGSNLGGYSDWRLPTIAELQSLYDNKEEIGGFNTDKIKVSSYWSGEICEEESEYQPHYYYLDFRNGSISSQENRPSYEHRGRCIRTIVK